MLIENAELETKIETLQAKLQAAEDKYSALVYMRDERANPDMAIKAALFRIGKLEAEVTALTELNEALEARLAMEVTA